MGSATASNFDFKSYTAERRALVEQYLHSYLNESVPATLWESMRYSVLSGGKRLRALLCLAGAEAASPSSDIVSIAMPCACAIELVHAMSLIHDDLPCMDDDDLRRGKPTNHKVFGEAMALLAGDALLMLATQILIEHTPKTVDRDVLLRVTAELSRASGAHGMVGGQVDDLIFTGAAASTISDTENTNNIIESIHRRKTGALIKYAIWSGAALAGADESQLSGFLGYGELLGLAFQIADDLLDVTGDAQTLGKTPGKDAASQKTTWVRVYGVDGARAKLLQMQSEGEELLSSLQLDDRSYAALSELLKYAIHRVN